MGVVSDCRLCYRLKRWTIFCLSQPTQDLQDFPQPTMQIGYFSHFIKRPQCYSLQWILKQLSGTKTKCQEVWVLHIHFTLMSGMKFHEVKLNLLQKSMFLVRSEKKSLAEML